MDQRGQDIDSNMVAIDVLTSMIHAKLIVSPAVQGASTF